MRHIFIVNPAAGKHSRACARVPEIEAFFAANPALGTPEIVFTEEQGHATRLAAAYAGSGEAVRLYACGGDGTLSEVLRGMYAYQNAELACPAVRQMTMCAPSPTAIFKTLPRL